MSEMSVAQRPLLDNPFRPVPSNDAGEIGVSGGPFPCVQQERPAFTDDRNSRLTEELRLAISKKNQLYVIARESNSPDDWQALKRQRNHIGKLLRESRASLGGAEKSSRKPVARPFKTDFYCDACDRGFTDQPELSAHLAEHTVCEREGCLFSACPQLVALHVKLQHDTGFIRRCPGAADDDAVEWRRQRRLRYPTLKNIEVKKAVQAELHARREVLEENPKRRFPERRRQKRRQQRNGRRRSTVPGSGHRTQTTAPSVPDDDVATPAPELNPFRGIGAPVTSPPAAETGDDQMQITDSDSDTNPTANAIDNTPLVGGALGALMTNYDSASEDDAEVAVPAEHSTQSATPNTPSATPNTPSATPNTPSTTPNTPSAPPAAQEPLPANCPIAEKAPASDAAPARSRPARRKAPAAPAQLPARRLTLLQKLLAPEIRHERNVVLQCVHFVVQNNFFAPPQTDPVQ